MTTARRLHHSYEAYLDALELSSLKLEYLDGEVYAMAGGTPTHAQLAARMIALLSRGLPAGCDVFTSDLKVRIEATDLSTFPDVSVVCGRVQPAAIDVRSVTNPSLLVEVTSSSTEDYDRGEKLRHFKHLATLKAVVFISHRRAQVTIVERTGTGWAERTVDVGELVQLEHPALTFPLNDLYAGIELEG